MINLNKENMKKTIYGSYPFYLVFILVSLTFIFHSCQKDDEDDLQRISANKKLYEIMSNAYYWYDGMPSVNPANYPSPYELMEALRNKQLDPWSYVSTWKEFEDYYKDSRFIGYGFGSLWDGGKLRVSFIFNTTDMYANGVRRGWIVERINNTVIQPGMNINQMLGANDIGVSNSFVFRRPDGSEASMTVQKKEVIMNTVLHREIIEAGDKKVGYLVFKSFIQSSIGELNEAVDFFNSAGIDDLVLDLRYNGGGQSDVALHLAAVIGSNALVGEPFAKYMYNDKLSADWNKSDIFKAVPQNLGLGRLITIATRQTASASEMVINGLRPFMDVYIVGDDTYGKPMGMNVWNHDDLYAFVPVTFKIANKESYGDYFDGLPADSSIPDDLSRNFGDTEEALLKEALNFIVSGSFSPQVKSRSVFVQPFEQMTGFRREIGAH
jgi:carboxyl-terminal processing protease